VLAPCIHAIASEAKLDGANFIGASCCHATEGGGAVGIVAPVRAAGAFSIEVWEPLRLLCRTLGNIAAASLAASGTVRR